MAFVHSKSTYVSLAGTDFSPFCDDSPFNRSVDSHDVTTYGKNDHVKFGGLGDGASTLTGFYDDGVAGPRAIVEPLLGSVVTLVYRAEGTGSGKPQDTVQVLIQSYNESGAVADMKKFEIGLEFSDAITTVDQP